MKKFLSVLVLTLFVSSATFASFPVKSSSNKNENAAVSSDKKTEKQSSVNQETEKNDSQGQVEMNKVEKKQAKTEKNTKSPLGDDTTIAIILAFVSVLIFPFGLHNWYLGRKKQALWQTLLVFPGFILLGIPAVISWIWQIVDLVRLLINGELPS